MHIYIYIHIHMHIHMHIYKYTYTFIYVVYMEKVTNIFKLEWIPSSCYNITVSLPLA
jgi:hypothetical protein